MRFNPFWLVVTVALGLLGAPLPAAAQQPAKVPLVAWLSPTSPDPPRVIHFGELRRGLRELGYVEGQNITVEPRWAEEKYDRLPALAAELVRLKVNVIVTGGVPAIRAAQQATRTIPIVMGLVEDPVANGLIASLRRPGGNTTGLSLLSHELVGKQFDLLKEVVPKVSLVAVLMNPANPGNPPQVREAQIAARAMGVRLQLLEARDSQEIDSAFAAMARERAGALLVVHDAMLATQRGQIAELAAKRRLPAVYARREHAEAGGLMSYGADIGDMFRRSATFVDKILKGANPADLPVEQPTRFRLVVNLKTAKALGLTIPRSVLGLADEVIQ